MSLILDMLQNLMPQALQNIGGLRGKRVLVTGGAGFVGSWVCDMILELGGEVHCLDNFSTGLASNIRHNKHNKNFKFIKQNVIKYHNTSGKFDFILHMASRASPEEYQMYPIETLEANSFGTKAMLELARKNDCPLLYTSTSEVYGDANIIPTPETYWGNVNPNGIRSCYDEAKRFGEALVAAYHRQYKLDARVVRIFNTYGPRIRHDGPYARALPRFCTQAIKNGNITVFGDGNQTRSFCFVTDTAGGLLLALTEKDAKGQFINIGNPNEITILELAKRIKNAANSSSRIIFKPLPEDDPKRRCPVIEKAKKLLGWQPRVSLDDGLQITLDWFKKNL